ncbi:hypothetical protein [Aquiflexum sp.]|uniref:hypothetical protein n=1 Tax=Aquiflexum sp. TaxID=1872584 RepID=UPI0035939D86
MKETFLLFIQILLTLSFVGLILGLIRPVLVLWFLDRFNRLKVIKVYGLLTVVSLMLLLILSII